MYELEMVKFDFCQVYEKHNQIEHHKEMVILYFQESQISTIHELHLNLNVQDAYATCGNQHEQNYKKHKVWKDMESKRNGLEKGVQL